MSVMHLSIVMQFGPGDELPVAGVVDAADGYYLEFDGAWLRDGFDLSPALPRREGVIGPMPMLPGALAGSLPDSWGALVLDKAAKAGGLSLRRPLDRLAFLGDRTMGAMVYRPPTSGPAQGDVVTLQTLARQARLLLTDRLDRLPTLLTRAASSAGGARPKFTVGLLGDDFYLGDPPPDAEPWLIKLAAPTDPPDTPAIEQAYMRMAAAAGIDVPEHRLFRSGKTRAFGMRRFDRIGGGGRLHTLTFADLYDLGPTEQTLGRVTYADLLTATRKLAGVTAARQMYRRMIFNVLAHNRDDHVRNHSFLADRRGLWTLSPAYDLTHADGPGGFHSLDLGDHLDPTRADLQGLAGIASVKKPSAVIDEVAAALASWPQHADEAGVSKRQRDLIRRDHDNVAASVG